MPEPGNSTHTKNISDGMYGVGLRWDSCRTASVWLEESVRTALLLLLLSVPAFAQSQPSLVTAACGPTNVTFSVSEGSAPLAPALPESGNALVYFIQDSGLRGYAQHYTLKIGLDGAWVGAYKKNSVFTVSVPPGVHHLCVNVQSISSAAQNLAFAHLTAEAGKIYYFRTRFLAGITMYPVSPYLALDQPDTDEAKYLIATYPESLFKPKK